MSGLLLKSLFGFLRAVQFCCAAIILGMYAFFLAELDHHGLGSATYVKTVAGISGVSMLYTLCAMLLVCCLGGIAYFSLFAMVLDLAFTGAFIYISDATRYGDGSCTGWVQTPVGSGNTYTSNTIQGPRNGTFAVSLSTACRLNTACFAVAVLATLLFFFSIFVDFGLIRHHRNEKAFGPSPSNGYTEGYGKEKFWRRRSKRNTALAAGGLAVNPDHLPAHQTPADLRDSYATDATAVGAEEPVYDKYNNAAPIGYNAGYTTHEPHNTGVVANF